MVWLDLNYQKGNSKSWKRIIMEASCCSSLVRMAPLIHIRWIRATHVYRVQVKIKVHRKDADGKSGWKERARKNKFQKRREKEQAAAHTHSRIKHLLYVNRSALRFSFHSAISFGWMFYFCFHLKAMVCTTVKERIEYTNGRKKEWLEQCISLGCVAYAQ